MAETLKLALGDGTVFTFTGGALQWDVINHAYLEGAPQHPIESAPAFPGSRTFVMRDSTGQILLGTNAVSAAVLVEADVSFRSSGDECHYQRDGISSYRDRDLHREVAGVRAEAFELRTGRSLGRAAFEGSLPECVERIESDADKAKLRGPIPAAQITDWIGGLHGG